MNDPNLEEAKTPRPAPPKSQSQPILIKHGDSVRLEIDRPKPMQTEDGDIESFKTGLKKLMTFKEIIDSERWEILRTHNGYPMSESQEYFCDLHSQSLDRIEAEASGLMFPAVRKIWVDEEGSLRIDFTGDWHIAMHDGHLSRLVKDAADPLHKRIAELEKRIAELEVLAPQWQPIETAPKDGAEIIGWREDCGAMLIRYTSPIEFLTDAELADLDEASADQSDWFYADFIAGGRLEGSDAPTHWMPLPKHPAES